MSRRKIQITDDYFFQGEIRVVLDVKCENLTKIEMHCANLSFCSESFRLQNLKTNQEIGIVEFDTISEFEILEIGLAEALPVGEGSCELTIMYQGYVNEGLRGLYTSTYFDEASLCLETLLVTQLCPVDARRIFPCFDQLDFKAVFE